MSMPVVINHQDRLLSVDTKVGKFLEGLLHPGIKVYPLFLDPFNGVWVLRVKFAPGVTVPLHFHTGTVHAYTMSGCWYYSEHAESKQTAGCYLFEPGGSVHTFNTPADNIEDTDAFMVVTGSNINFDGPSGTYLGVMDAGFIKAWCDQAIKDQKATGVDYISAAPATFASSTR